MSITGLFNLNVNNDADILIGMIENPLSLRHVDKDTISGSSGSRGQTGPTGPTGLASVISGATGLIGPTGPIGATGLVNLIQGPTGSTGLRGFMGPIGPPSTSQGPSGSTGLTGFTGPAGDNSGPTGPTGSNLDINFNIVPAAPLFNSTSQITGSVIRGIVNAPPGVFGGFEFRRIGNLVTCTVPQFTVTAWSSNPSSNGLFLFGGGVAPEFPEIYRPTYYKGGPITMINNTSTGFNNLAVWFARPDGTLVFSLANPNDQFQLQCGTTTDVCLLWEIDY